MPCPRVGEHLESDAEIVVSTPSNSQVHPPPLPVVSHELAVPEPVSEQPGTSEHGEAGELYAEHGDLIAD